MKNNKMAVIQTAVLGVLLFGLAFFCWFNKADEYSDSERRELAQFPGVTFDSIISGDFMTDFEDYTLDQFPLREKWRTLKSVFTFYVFGQLDNNDIYIADGYASKLEYPLSEKSVSFAADKFRWIYDRYVSGSDAQVYLSIIPDKNYFLAEDNGYLSLDYEKFISLLREETDDFMTYIDIFGTLSLEDYYRTDTHWRQEAIVDTAQKIGEGMGVSFSDVYTEQTLDEPFYGVYYGQSALPLEADELRWLTSDVLDGCLVYDYQNQRESTVYDMERAYGKDPYEMFLSGPISLITIENPNAQTDRELVVFRDSFGSSIAPLFVSGYAKITLVDIRYLPSITLGNYLTFENQDVLFLYSTLVLNNSGTLK